MTIEEIKQKADQVRHLEWLYCLWDSYHSFSQYIRKNLKDFTIQSIGYTCRGDGCRFQLNPHRPIDCVMVSVIIDMAAHEIAKEAEALKKELESTNINDEQNDK